MKKKQIANLIMVSVILLIVAGGVLGVGYIRGWFDTASENIASLTELQGTVNMERSGVIYPVEQDTVLRSGDKIMTNPGASAVIRRGNDTVILGGNTELTVTDPGTKQFALRVTKGELFANTQQSVQFTYALGEAAVENATAALSVRDGAQTVYVFRGTVGEANAGQATEYVGDTVSTQDMQLEGLNDFLLTQIRKANNTITLCYTNQDLDDLEVKRQQAIQDMLNGQSKPDAHTHSYTVSVVEPCCNTGGYTEYVCECGDKYRDEETAALSHTWGQWKNRRQPKRKGCKSESVPIVRPRKKRKPIRSAKIIPTITRNKLYSRPALQKDIQSIPAIADTPTRVIPFLQRATVIRCRW